MVCPNCRHAIAWYKVAYISRWTNVRCETCQRQWNRNFDLQFWLVVLFGMTVPVLLAWGLFSELLFRVDLIGIDPFFLLTRFFVENRLFVLLGLVWLGVMTYADARTVKLVPAIAKKPSMDPTDQSV